ncbi:MAG: Adenylate cyclase 2 [Syntrophorhabdus sp. PtaB.Bin006]|nr:MAG: Adenylate cyclase 2 [Syntrophorhabdus sp. PtaB.Bin006]
MVKCVQCGAENRDQARFCHSCGAPLGRRCKQCGNESLPSARFCDACGYSLVEKSAGDEIGFGFPSSYTPKSLADKILTNRTSIEGERKLVSVVFVDVADYTSICEQLDPEDIHQIMDKFFRLLMDEIHRYEGTISQFTGDGVMALFGAPVAHEDHAQRACHAALAIQGALKNFNLKVRVDYGVEFAVRTGINSGLVMVGSIGDDLRMDYTALGDTTNLASRMETTAIPGSILVSEDTHKLTKDFFLFRALGKIAVKGKSEPLEAHELLGFGQAETRIDAAVVRGLTKFVGREKELQGLEKAFERVRSRSGQIVSVVGEAGVGKSRLVLEFRNLLYGTGNTYTYLEGRCFHFGGSMAYRPIIDILRSYFNATEGTREHVIKKSIEETIKRLDPELLSIQPPLHELLSLSVEDESYLKLEPKLKRERIFEAVRDLLLCESRSMPLILVFEDLHWIDKTTEEFLSYLIEWVPNVRILLLLLHRPEYVYPWKGKSYHGKIDLGQLPAIASSEMVKSLLEGGDVSPELRELVIGRAGGNPLFMEELIYALLESGYIKRGRRRYTLDRKLWEIPVPDTVQGIIAARMDRLESSHKWTMQVASVMGREFTFAILDMITGRPEDLKSHLASLQTAEFIYEKSSVPEAEYTFKHALVQEVAYNSLLLRRRKEIHEKIGNAIEEFYKERLEEFYEMLAYHYTASENREKAYHYLKASGLKAARSSSLWEAFRFFRDASTALKGQPVTPENAAKQVEIALYLISPMLSLGFPDDSLYMLQNGESLAKEIGDIRGLTTLCSAIGLYFSIKGDTMRGLQYNEECFEVAEQEQDIDLMAPVAFDLCSNYTARGEFLKMLAMAPGIRSRLEQSGKESESFGRGYNLYSAFAAFQGFSTAYLGEYEKGRLILENGLDFARKIGNLYSLGLIEVFYGYSWCHQGDGEKALPHFEKSISYLEKGQIFVLLGLAWTGVGWAYYFMGKPDTALPYIEKGLEIHSQANVTYNLSVHYWFLSEVYCDLGNREKARSCVDEALRLAEMNHEIYYVGLANVTLGQILGKEGLKVHEAEEAIRRGIGILEDLRVEPQVGIGHLRLAELLATLNKSEQASASFRKAETIFEKMNMNNWLAKSEAIEAALSQT